VTAERGLVVIAAAPAPKGTAGVLKDSLRNSDVIAGAALAALGAYILVESREWGYFGEDGPGPSFFPALYGGSLLVLSPIFIVMSVRKGERQQVDWPAVRRALGVWAAFALSVALMPWLGFLLSFGLLTFFMIAFVYREPLLTALGVAIASSAAFYVVFPFALSVPLPTGIFGF
jgi:putative tricarboxylic transport membrane protein